jgi:hypothetical protein
MLPARLLRRSLCTGRRGCSDDRENGAEGTAREARHRIRPACPHACHAQGGHSGTRCVLGATLTGRGALRRRRLRRLRKPPNAPSPPCVPSRPSANPCSLSLSARLTAPALAGVPCPLPKRSSTSSRCAAIGPLPLPRARRRATFMRPSAWCASRSSCGAQCARTAPRAA